MHIKDAKQAIILEDDLEVSPDFFRYIHTVHACMCTVCIYECVCNQVDTYVFLVCVCYAAKFAHCFLAFSLIFDY